MPPGHQWSVFLSLTLPYTAPINPQHITLILTHAHTHTHTHTHTRTHAHTHTPTHTHRHTHTHTHTLSHSHTGTHTQLQLRLGLRSVHMTHISSPRWSARTVLAAATFCIRAL